MVLDTIFSIELILNVYICGHGMCAYVHLCVCVCVCVNEHFFIVIA